MEDKKPMPWLKNATPLCLASASPRRLELLQQAGIEPFVHATKVDETVKPSESPHHYVERMAREKAQAGLVSGYETVLGADTVVVLDGEALGKPKSESDAIKMLTRLSGRSHQVFTTIALIRSGSDEIVTRTVETRVWFKKNSSEEIAAYVATKEPMDKAGSYGIQGIGAFMVEKIEGSYTAVVGLPLFETLGLLSNSN